MPAETVAVLNGLRPIPWRDRLVLAVVLIIGSALTWVAGKSLGQSSELQLSQQKALAVQAVVEAFQHEVTRTLEAVRNAGLMLEANPTFTREQYKRYMQSLVENQLSVNLIEWQPIVPAKELAQFESAVRAQGLVDFRVLQPDASSKGWEPVHGRDEYVPILYAWPENYLTVGMDMSFSPERMASKIQSLKTGSPKASGVFMFMKDGKVNSGSKAVAISTAVLDPDPSHHARGYLAAVVDLPTLFQKAADQADLNKVDLVVLSSTAPNGPPVFTWNGDPSKSDTGLSLAQMTSTDASAVVDFAGQSWRILLQPRPGTWGDRPVRTAFWIYTAGSVMTLLLFTILLVYLRMNVKLGREIAIRSLAEHELHRRQSMLERTESAARLASFEWEVKTNKVTWSPEMFRILDRDPAQGIPNLEGQAELYTPGSTQVLFDAVREAVSNGTPYTLELMTAERNGHIRTCFVKGFPERDSDGQVVRLTGLVQDITERKRAEQYETFRSQTLELIAANVPLTRLLEAIVRGVEDLHPGMLCSILLLDSSGQHFKKGVAPSLPDFYNMAVDGLAIGLGVGSCGTAAFTGERVIVEDIATHPYWDAFKDLTTQAGLGACWSQPIRGSDHRVLGTFAIYHRTAHAPEQADIDLIEQIANLTSIAIERKSDEERLRQAAGVFTFALEGIMITGSNGIIIDVNEAFTRITGYSHAEAVGQNPRLLSSGRQDAQFYKAMWSALTEQGHWSGEVWNRRKNGEVYAELLTISAVRSDQGDVQQYIALFSDITAIKRHQSQLEQMAHYDALTALPNRLLLSDRLHQAMALTQRRGDKLAVIYLDLDGFKSVNDQHGHDVGDQLLVAAAKRMKEALRESDTLARIGGDEFVAVLIDLPDASASLPLVNRLLVAAALPLQVGDLSLQVSASLGISIYPRADDIDADQLLRQADHAMYQAKIAGKNQYSFYVEGQDSGSVKSH